jgi:hypothetical protein
MWMMDQIRNVGDTRNHSAQSQRLKSNVISFSKIDAREMNMVQMSASFKHGFNKRQTNIKRWYSPKSPRSPSTK